MPSLCGAAVLVVAGAIVVGEILAVVTTVEFLGAAEDKDVAGTAAAELEIAAPVVGAGAGLDSAGATLEGAGAALEGAGAAFEADGATIGVEALGTGAGVAD